MSMGDRPATAARTHAGEIVGWIARKRVPQRQRRFTKQKNDGSRFLKTSQQLNVDKKTHGYKILSLLSTHKIESNFSGLP